MADVYTKGDGSAITSSDTDLITQHMTACGHAVVQIDGIKAGTDYYRTNNGFTQAEINDCVERSVGHLETMQKESWYIADRVSRSGNAAKAKHTTAIATGKQYITDNT